MTNDSLSHRTKIADSLVLICCSFLAVMVAPITAWGQSDPIIQPRLLLEGPAQQEISLVLEYFDNGVASSVIQTRVTLTEQAGEGGVASEELEFGHEGIRILALVPTKSGVSVSLMDGEKPLETRRSASPGVLELRTGAIAEQRIDPPRFLPNDSEREVVLKLVKLFLQDDPAEQRAVLKAIVSPQAIANVDWPTALTWVQAARAKLGTLERLSNDELIEGWQSLRGNLGARLVTGMVRLQEQPIRLTLSLLDGKIVDIKMDSFGSLDEWFQGPLEVDLYREQARRMLASVLANKPDTAHALFGRLYKQEVPLKSMKEWAEKLQTDFGGVDQLELQEEVFRRDAPDIGQGLLRFTFNGLARKENPTGAKRAIVGHVSFIFDCEADAISKGSLANVDIRETWPSAQPALAQLAASILADLRSGKPPKKSDFHPSAASLIDWQNLQVQIETASSSLRELPDSLGFSNWRARYQDERGFAEGTLSVRKEQVKTRFEFWQGKLIGFRLEGRDWACNSFSAVAKLPELRASAAQFWSLLLEQRWEEAHQELPAGFQAQVPYSTFRTMMERNSLTSKPSSIEWEYATLSDAPDRPSPLVISCFQSAESPDGFEIALLTSYRWTGGDWELLSFDNGFSNRVVNPPSTRDVSFTQTLFEALNSKQAEVAIDLLGSHATGAYVEITTAFLDKLDANIGPLKLQGTPKLVHRYEAGTRFDWEYGTVRIGDSELIPINVKSQSGELRAFQLFTPKLKGFAASPALLRRVEKIGDAFLSDWLEQPNIQATFPYLVQELRSTDAAIQISEMRSRLLSIGDVAGWDIQESSFDIPTQRVLCRFQIRFANQATTALELAFRVDAFTAHLAGLRKLD